MLILARQSGPTTATPYRARTPARRPLRVTSRGASAADLSPPFFEADLLPTSRTGKRDWHGMLNDGLNSVARMYSCVILPVARL
jgi:hypothetical protein